MKEKYEYYIGVNFILNGITINFKSTKIESETKLDKDKLKKEAFDIIKKELNGKAKFICEGTDCILRKDIQGFFITLRDNEWSLKYRGEEKQEEKQSFLKRLFKNKGGQYHGKKSRT